MLALTRSTRRPSADAGAAACLLRADAIPIDAPLREAIELFRRHPDARFLAVVDADQRPLGAVHEKAVRDLLFSPFGHALLANPGCRWTLQDMVSPCASVDAGASVEAMIAAYGEKPACEGLIVTKGGVYHALLPGPSLLRLAAGREREEQQWQQAEAAAAIARGQALEEAFARFRADAQGISEALTSAAGSIHDHAREVASRANRNGEQSLAVAAAARQSSHSIAEVASNSAALAGECQAIEGRVAEALDAFDRAVTHVEHGVGKARSLTVAADEIGSITGLIAAVARKVNMLAINATIEAARAGPAGRTFAVVAGEVKSLAGQASRAAQQIEERVQTVRAAVTDNAAANQAVETIVRGLGGVCADISRSVAGQASATRIIADNVDQAARGSESVSSHIVEIGERASTAGDMAVRLGDVAKSLGVRAGDLRERVDHFLEELKAA